MAITGPVISRFDSLRSDHFIVSRVKFNGTAVYSNTELYSTDDSYKSLSGTSLHKFLNGTNNFAEAHSNKIYRLAGGSNPDGSNSIPLCRATRMSRVGCVGILQEGLTSANATCTLSVGLHSDKNILLGALPITSLITPTTGTTAIWHPIASSGTSSTCAEALTYTPTFFQPYLGFCVVAPKSVFSLHLSDPDEITTGDITFIFFGEPLDPGIITDTLERFALPNNNMSGSPYQCIIPAY